MLLNPFPCHKLSHLLGRAWRTLWTTPNQLETPLSWVREPRERSVSLSIKKDQLGLLRSNTKVDWGKGRLHVDLNKKFRAHWRHTVFFSFVEVGIRYIGSQDAALRYRSKPSELNAPASSLVPVP